MNFDREMANEYDKGVRRTLPTYDALFRLVQTYLRNHVSNDAQILIVGAGGGNELAILAPQNPAWAFTAVDPSAPMLELAKQKAQQFELKNDLHFIKGTIDDVNSCAQYDAATFMLVLHFIEHDEEKLAQLKSIRERLSNGAPFIIATMFGNTESAEFKEQLALWKAYWLDSTDLTEEDVDEMEKAVRNLSFLPEEKIVNMLQEAGFGNIAKFFTTNMFGGWICKAN
ncbi:class I SAM-dependent methyltransferase [Sporosarcina pasteurii]|nr:class I SAM-dependent methyltransferase [Sporosarcina pasteurii]